MSDFIQLLRNNLGTLLIIGSFLPQNHSKATCGNFYPLTKAVQYVGTFSSHYMRLLEVFKIVYAKQGKNYILFFPIFGEK